MSNVYCSAIFYQLHFIGWLCFGIFSVAVMMQLFEFAKMLYYIWTIGTII
jgi:hypothetical protein